MIPHLGEEGNLNGYQMISWSFVCVVLKGGQTKCLHDNHSPQKQSVQLLINFFLLHNFGFLEPSEIDFLIPSPPHQQPQEKSSKDRPEIHPGHSEQPEEYVAEHRRYTQGSPSRPTNPWTAQEPGFRGLFPPSTQCCATRGWCAGLHTWQEDEWR